ncbi:MAG: hypothetical protein RLY86_4199 [Pseudomonadota bacterium]|jgi:two-component sensor histidine kinase
MPAYLHAALRYLGAFLTFLAALGLRQVLDDSLPPGFPFLTFFPAVILTAYFLGTGPGLLCALLCGLSAWYWFMPPVGGFGLDGGTAVAIGLYAFIVGVDIVIIDAMRRAGDRLRIERELSAALADQQRTLFAELQHRVANNLAFTASLLTLQRSRIAADPSTAVAGIDAAIHRLHLMGRLHRLLHDPASVGQSLEDYMRALCAMLLEVTDAEHVTCEVDVIDLRMGLERLTVFSLLTMELMTNAVKHAFLGRDGGRLILRLERVGPDQVVLTVSDDGPGMTAEATRANGLGLRIVEALATQLQGNLILPGPGDSATRVVFTG